MIKTPIQRTWVLCLSLTLLLIQVPVWANFFQILGFLGVFCTIFSQISRKNDEINLNFISIFAFLYLIIGIFGVFISAIPFSSIKLLPIYMILPLVMACASIGGDKDDLISMPVFTKFLIACGGILSLYAIWQVYSGTGYYKIISNYPFFNPNSLGVFLGICLLASFVTIIQSTRPSILIYISAIVTFTAICTTGSKASIIGVIFTFIVMMLYHLKISQIIDKKKLGIVSIGFLVMIFIAPLIYQNLVTHGGGAAESLVPKSSSPNSRLVIWEGAVDTALSTHPIIGNGIGTFKDVYLPYRLPGDNASGNHAHNDVLHIWVEMGLWGLIVFAIGAVGVFIALRDMVRDKCHVRLLPMLIIIFCGGMALVTPIISSVPISMVLALSLVCVMPKNIRQVPYGDYIRQGLMVVLILICGLAIRNFTESIKVNKIKPAIESGELGEFLSAVDAMDILSFGLNPAVPIYRVSSLLALYDNNMIPEDKHEPALKEMGAYIDDAERRNPYNPEILFYRGELAMRMGKQDTAIKYWQDTITLDPSYLVARVKLLELLENSDEKRDLILGGLYIRYTKQNPMQLYAIALIEARKMKDEALIELIQDRIKSRLK